jgi:hypothetical protein
MRNLKNTYYITELRQIRNLKNYILQFLKNHRLQNTKIRVLEKSQTSEYKDQTAQEL